MKYQTTARQAGKKNKGVSDMKLSNAKARKLIASGQSEDQIHISILNWLDVVLPNDASPAWHTPNGGKRSMREGVKMKRLGVRAGFPDLAFIWRCRLYTIEVKTATGSQRQNQKDWENWIVSLGGFYAVCRSIKQAEQQLIQWGILK